MRSFVASLLLSLVGLGPAAGADLLLPPQPRFDVEPPYAHWGGVYLGLNGGSAAGASVSPMNYRFSW